MDFKKEIEEKFGKSQLKKFTMPRLATDTLGEGAGSGPERETPDQLFQQASIRQ